MDFTVLIILCLVVLAIGLPIGVKYLSDKKLINTESLTFAINLFKISASMVGELNLSQEPLIEKLTNAILLSLNYCCNMENTTDRLNIAINYCIELCGQMGIEMTENRIEIVENLLRLGLQDATKTITV